MKTLFTIALLCLSTLAFGQGQNFPNGGSGGAGVSSFSGDGTVITNVNNTGAVTATIGTIPPAKGGVAVVSTAGQGGEFLPYGDACETGSAVNSSNAGTNALRGVQFVLRDSITFTKGVISIATTSSTNHVIAGIYNAAGTTLLQTFTWTLGAGTGPLSTTVTSNNLAPGVYWLLWGNDNATSVPNACITQPPTGVGIVNLNATRYGNSSAVITAGAMPATIGTMTGSSAFNPIMVYLEP